MDRALWEGKKVLITGHTGFKGSWLSLWLQSLGAHVLGYALPPPTKPSLFEVARVADGMKSFIGDVRDLSNVKTVFAEFQPEIVIHMAAQSLVRYSYNHPVETYATNIMGTINVLEAVRQTQSARVVVCITSDKCYENKEWVWGYRENDRMGGHDPYSSSKGCAELVTSAYRNSYFPANEYQRHRVAVASVRAGNVIGGGDWAKDRLVPDIMNAIIEDRSIIIRNPSAVRPWQHVLEPLAGYLALVERLWMVGAEFASAWNFGPNDEDAKPVSWIVEHLTAGWGWGKGWELDSTENPHEANYLKLDCSKARSLLGFSPKLPLSTALEWVVEWHKSCRENKDMQELTQVQIARYENMAAT